ncbi:MAG TPA: metallophosphoesterase family protein [Paludibacteraceae bacterium]|nr:metallophosphoesterase family protein [Paludibacteraceae bacterium]
MTNKKKIKYVIILLIVIALGIWIASRWNVWFGNPEEPAYVVSKTPTRVLLTMGNSGKNSRAVSWTCDTVLTEAYLDLVKVGAADTSHIKAQGQICKSRSGVSAIYNAFMDFLTPNSNYRYRVRNNSVASDWFQFATHRDSATSSCSFIYFGDVQDGDSNSVTKSLFRDIFTKNNDIDFALFGGDFIERPMDKYWEMGISSLDTVATSLPILAIPGNHEYLKGVTRKLDRRYDYVFPYYLDSKLRKNHVFTFPFGNVRFYFLDSNRDFWNYYAQRKWLKRELDKSSATWNIVVLHHPIYSLKGSVNGLLVRAAFESVINKGDVDLVLQAHEHGYGRRATYDEKGNLTTPVYTVSYFSEKGYALTFGGDYDRWGSYYRYYQKIEANADTLSLRTYTSEGILYDDIQLVKDGETTKVLDNAKNIPMKVDLPETFIKQKGESKYQKAKAIIDEWKNENGVK